MRSKGLPLLLIALPFALAIARLGNPVAALQDTDTRVALEKMAQRGNPWSYFWTDWPLENHFYRPLPTLSYALDNALGGTAFLFVSTNILLVALCAMLGFCWINEVLGSIWKASAGIALFVAWLFLDLSIVSAPMLWIVALLALVAAIRNHKGAGQWAPALLTLAYLPVELAGAGPMRVGNSGDLGPRTMLWIPGRTATIMTLFAMLSLVAYLRYMGVSVERKEPTAEDRPMTKGSEQAQGRATSFFWFVISLLSATAAFASYEQAVMLPAVLTISYIIATNQSRKAPWVSLLPFWLLIPAYLALRHAVLPEGVSQYQHQQLRHSVSVLYDLLYCAIPNYSSIGSLKEAVLSFGALLLTQEPYLALLSLASNAVAYVQLRSQWITAFGSLALCLAAYLPMAWLKYFGHYAFWPQLLRIPFVVILAERAFSLALSAVARPALQAPKRLHPALGSLPHP